MDTHWKNRVKAESEAYPTVMLIDDNREQLCKDAQEMWMREFNVIAVHVNNGGRDDRVPRYGIPLHEVKAVRDVLRLVDEKKPDCILSDWNLEWGHGTGDVLLNELQFEAPKAVLALHSAKFHARERAEAYDCFPKSQGLAAVAEYFNTQLARKNPNLPPR